MLSLPQHIASNVTEGLDPRRGVGFQTLAASEELLDTEDLRYLEEMAPYYQASRADRQAGTLPVRELCYRLPSGSLAVTRIEDWGVDPHGRAGNALAHSLVVPGPVAESRWDPTALLDHLVASRPAELPAPGTLPALVLPDLPPPSRPAAPAADADWLAALLAGLLGNGAPVFLVAPRDRARSLIRLLAWALPDRERKRLTFATHFYRDCDPHRDRFRLVTIENEGEGPLDLAPYHVVREHERCAAPASSPLATYLARLLAASRWDEAEAFRDRVDRLRRGEAVSHPALEEPEARALLEAAGPQIAPLLSGKPHLISGLLDTPRPDRDLAEALLRSGGPSQLCGGSAESERGTHALRTLESAAGKQAWREWAQRWADELPQRAGARRMWWEVWKR